jgi:hypothetical protein
MRSIKWISGKAWDLASNNSGALFLWLTGSGLMFYLGSITEWAKWLGPLGWALIAIAATGVVTVCYSLIINAANGNAMRKFTEGKIQAQGVNVLAPAHLHERINLIDFYNPFHFPLENVSFTDCELYGPASVIVTGNVFKEVRYVECEIVIARDDRPIKGALKINNSSFLRGKLVRVTLLMSLDHYRHLPEEFRRNIPVISDGRAGDINESASNDSLNPLNSVLFN